MSPIAPVHSEPCSSSCVCVCEIPVFAPIEKQTFCDLNFFKEDFGNLRPKVSLSTSPRSWDRDELGRILNASSWAAASLDRSWKSEGSQKKVSALPPFSFSGLFWRQSEVVHSLVVNSVFIQVLKTSPLNYSMEVRCYRIPKWTRLSISSQWRDLNLNSSLEGKKMIR